MTTQQETRDENDGLARVLNASLDTQEKIATDSYDVFIHDNYKFEIVGGIARDELLAKRTRQTPNRDLRLRAYLDGYNSIETELAEQPTKIVGGTNNTRKAFEARDRIRHNLQQYILQSGNQERITALKTLYVLWQVANGKQPFPKNLATPKNLAYFKRLGVEVTPIQ